MTTRDPSYINPEIKSELRCKNRWMRAGRVDEAGAIADVRIGKEMAKHSKSQLNKIGGRIYLYKLRQFKLHSCLHDNLKFNK